MRATYSSDILDKVDLIPVFGSRNGAFPRDLSYSLEVELTMDQVFRHGRLDRRLYRHRIKRKDKRECIPLDRESKL